MQTDALDLIATAVLLLDRELRLRQLNAAAESLFAMSPRHVLGQRLVELLQPFHVDLKVCDPYLSAEVADRLGIVRAGLDEGIATPTSPVAESAATSDSVTRGSPP